MTVATAVLLVLNVKRLNCEIFKNETRKFTHPDSGKTILLYVPASRLSLRTIRVTVVPSQ